jgi:glutamate---cysteine ligase / carboxylate-amine ligase
VGTGPSFKHPTLELRICDSCTSVEDAVAIACLYRALVRHLLRQPHVNARRDALSRALAEENRWRAQRYGMDGTLIDASTRKTLPVTAILASVIADLEADIAAIGVRREIEHIRTIAVRGTSAHQQLRHYRELRKLGEPQKKSMRLVSTWLRESTEAGDFLPHEPHHPVASSQLNGDDRTSLQRGMVVAEMR